MRESKFKGDTKVSDTDTLDKIIFLDIDGVLNGYGLYISLLMKFCSRFNLVSWFHRHHLDLYSVHKRKFKRLVKIVRTTKAKIVLSSSWRYAYVHYPDQADIRTLYNLIDEYNVSVISTLRLCDPCERRADLISEWLDKNPVDKFVIIDDEVQELIARFPDNVVSTAPSKLRNHHFYGAGLKNKHIKQAVKILSD